MDTRVLRRARRASAPLALALQTRRRSARAAPAPPEAPSAPAAPEEGSLDKNCQIWCGSPQLPLTLI